MYDTTIGFSTPFFNEVSRYYDIGQEIPDDERVVGRIGDQRVTMPKKICVPKGVVEVLGYTTPVFEESCNALVARINI